MSTVLRIVTHPTLQFLAMVGFLALALHFRFILPRYDYWDVVYQSTYIVDSGVLNLNALYAFLLEPQADQLMTLTKGTVFLTNHLAGPHVIVLEIVVGWLLLIVAYLSLLCLLRLPVARWRSLDAKGAFKLLIVFVLYWWPATLPSLTNHWFALQYGLLLSSCLGAMYFLIGGRPSNSRYLLGCALFVLGALSHGTGLLLGPALAIWLGIKRGAPVWVVGFLAVTSVVLLALVWLQHQNAQYPDAGWSIETLEFLARIVTPPFWELAVFVLIFVPLLGVALWVRLTQNASPASDGVNVMLIWGLLVWIATFVARHEFQDHANPHYLRFNVLFYIALCVTVIDATSRIDRKVVAWVVSVVFLVVWIKGFEKGVSMAHDHRVDNLLGFTSLADDTTEENSRTEYLYPRWNHRLTRVLIPRLLEYDPYGYREMLGQ